MCVVAWCHSASLRASVKNVCGKLGAAVDLTSVNRMLLEVLSCYKSYRVSVADL